MIADEYAINARNPYKNRMHSEGIERTGWYNNQTEIDYRGSDVTVQMFMDSLLGTAPKALKNLNADSNLMIYITGHGGNQFFKFQDEEELTAQDIANLMDKLYVEKKFAKALFIADTCQAFTLFDKVTTPNVMALGTSLIDESAYAHHSDNDLGLAVIERWTHYFIKSYKKHTNPLTTLYQTMVSPFANQRILMARVGIKDDTSHSTFKNTKLSDFFGTKGGAKSSRGKPKPKETIVGVSTENLLKLRSLDLDITSSDEEHSTQSLVSDNCSTKSNSMNLLDNGFYAFICCFGAMLVLSKKLEKRFLIFQ